MARACVFQPEMSPLGNVPFPPSSCANFPKIIPLNFDQALTHSLQAMAGTQLAAFDFGMAVLLSLFPLNQSPSKLKTCAFPNMFRGELFIPIRWQVAANGREKFAQRENQSARRWIFPGARTFRLINIRKKESEFGCVTYHIRKSINAQLGSIHPGRNGEFG